MPRSVSNELPREAAEPQVQVLTRHRRCRGCQYDLYNLPTTGTCPECGVAYSTRGRQKPRKNPRRQHAQLSRMLRRSQQQHMRLPWFWLVAGAAVTACIMFHAGRGWWCLAALSALVAAVRHLTVTFDISDVKEKLQQIDWTPPPPSDGRAADSD